MEVGNNSKILSSLSEYCKKTNYPYLRALYNIEYLRYKYPSLTLGEIVDIIKRYYINLTTNLTYDGMPLSVYCKKNNISYDNIMKYIYIELDNNSDMWVEDIISNYMEAIDRMTYSYRRKFLLNSKGKYYYNGMPLWEYCQSVGYNYHNIVHQIQRRKELGEYSGLHDIEIVERFMKNYKPKSFIGYKGITLHKYCSNMNIEYNNVLRYLNNFKRIFPDLSEEERIDRAVETEKNRIKKKALKLAKKD